MNLKRGFQRLALISSMILIGLGMFYTYVIVKPEFLLYKEYAKSASDTGWKSENNEINIPKNGINPKNGDLLEFDSISGWYLSPRDGEFYDLESGEMITTLNKSRFKSKRNINYEINMNKIKSIRKLTEAEELRILELEEELTKRGVIKKNEENEIYDMGEDLGNIHKENIKNRDEYWGKFITKIISGSLITLTLGSIPWFLFWAALFLARGFKNS